MTPFEFIALAISVILGLAITRLISGIGVSIRQIRLKRFSWIHGLWQINIFILIPGFWWGLYEWSNLPNWNFFHFIFLIIYITNLYLITDFLIPNLNQEGINFKEHFTKNRKMFFILLFLSFPIDLYETSILVNENLREFPKGYFLTNISLSILTVLNLFSKKLWLDYVLGALWTLILVAYIVFSIFLIT